MDPDYCLQDVLRCYICEISLPSLHCGICEVNICKVCEEKHLQDKSKLHEIVPFKNRGIVLKCQIHSSRICSLHCEQCDIPICVECAFSKEQQGHKFVDIMTKIETQKKILQCELKELVKYIYPRYQEMASNISVQKVELKLNSNKLAEAIGCHAEDIHRELDNIIKKMQSDLDEMESKQLVVLTEHENEIARTISDINKTIIDQKNILDKNDVRLICTYRPRNAEFRKLPPLLKVSQPIFTPQRIDYEQINQQCGFLSAFSIQIERQNYVKDDLDTESYQVLKTLIEKPKVITEIKTEFGLLNGLCSVSSLSDEHVWTCGLDNIMRLYNLQGDLIKSVQTNSGYQPCDIALTSSGHLVYTDYNEKTVNIVKEDSVEEVIRLQGWVPLSICSTSSDELLVVMVSDNDKQTTKLVRYSGSKVKQSIQFNNKGQPLYSSGVSNKYVTENKNLDICIADDEFGAVVVVNKDGEFRFTYTGPPSSRKGSFHPFGITTDSQSRIIIANRNDDCIHIINQDGQFLRHVDNCYLYTPWGLCIDTADNLFVAEYYTGKVKIIQYSM